MKLLPKFDPQWIVAVLVILGIFLLVTQKVPSRTSSADQATTPETKDVTRLDIQNLQVQISGLARGLDELETQQRTLLNPYKNSWEWAALNEAMQNLYVRKLTHRGTVDTTFLRYAKNSLLAGFSLPNRFLDLYSEWIIRPETTAGAAGKMAFQFDKPVTGAADLWPPTIATVERSVRISSQNIITTAHESWPLARCGDNATETIRRVAGQFLEQLGRKEAPDSCELVEQIGTTANPFDSTTPYSIYRFGHAPSTRIPILFVREPWKPEEYSLAVYVELSIGGQWPFYDPTDPTEEDEEELAKELEAIVLPFVKSVDLMSCDYACAY